MTFVVIPEGSVYRYWDQSSVAVGWSTPGFDDSAWASGPSPLGFGDPHIQTTIGFGPDPNKKYTTAWFRTTFSLSGAASVTGATFEILRDDGAVVYLNGQEVLRSNMPDGPIDATTLASQLIVDAGETTWYTYSVSPAAFVEGTNVVAIEVHQQVLDSSDMGLDTVLTVTQN